VSEPIETISDRINAAVNRFVRRARPLEQPPPPPPKPDPQQTDLRGLFADERIPSFISWLDSQLASVKLQRNSPEVRCSHPDLLTLIGFENGLEAVRNFITTFPKE
jgi:hypothetical protein